MVGSRAANQGRNINFPDLPARGKGPGTRSDIDFRFDTLHPQAQELRQALNGVSNGAGSAQFRHSNNPLDVANRGRETRLAFIAIGPGS